MMIRTSHVYHMTDIAFHVRVCSKYDCAALVATINLILCTHTIRTDDKKSDVGTTIQRRRRLFRQEKKQHNTKNRRPFVFPMFFFPGVFCTFFSRLFIHKLWSLLSLRIRAHTTVFDIERYNNGNDNGKHSRATERSDTNTTQIFMNAKIAIK